MNKKQHICLAIGLCCCLFQLTAQELERQIFSTAGHSYSETIHVDYTIGEAVTSTFQGAFHNTQGFQQGEYQATSLAAEALKLRGQRLNTQQVKLTWETLIEDTETVFIVQRQLNKENTFSNIGTVRHADMKQWTFLDENSSPDLTYYRLQKKGQTTYSNTIAIQGMSLNNTFQLSPNPVKDIIQLSVNLDERQDVESLTFQLSDALGRTIMERILPIGETIYTIDGFDTLPSGTYFAILKNGKKVWQQWQIVK